MVEWIEVAIILGSVIGAISSVSIDYVIHRRNKELLERQKKADAAPPGSVWDISPLPAYTLIHRYV